MTFPRYAAQGPGVSAHLPPLPVKSHARCAHGLGRRTRANVGEHVYLDVGEIKEAGGVAGLVLVMTDQESRFVEARALSNHTAQSVIEAFHWGWVVPYGSPISITTDNAAEFKSGKWKEYLTLIGAEHKPSSIYNPQGDMAETAVKKVKDHVVMLRSSQAFSSRTSLRFDMLLMNACRALIAKWSNAAQGRPEEIFLGRPRRGFDDHLLGSRLHTAPAAAVRRAPRTEPFFDTRARYPVFPVGTLVCLLEQRSQKRGSRLLRASGPYRVVTLSRGTQYWLEDMAGDPLPTQFTFAGCNRITFATAALSRFPFWMDKLNVASKGGGCCA